MILVFPAQLITGDSTLLFVASAGLESSYAAPQSPLGQKRAAAEEVDTFPTCRDWSLPQAEPQAPAAFPFSWQLTYHLFASEPSAPSEVLVHPTRLGSQPEVAGQAVPSKVSV